MSLDSPIDNQPHVLVVYEDEDRDTRDQWPQSITAFPTRAAAEAIRKIVANYSGATCDVFLLQQPANDALSQSLIASATVDDDAVSLGQQPAPTGAHSHAVKAAADKLCDLINEVHSQAPSTGTRDIAIALAQFLHDAYQF